jgi:thioredoxin 1
MLVQSIAEAQSALHQASVNDQILLLYFTGNFCGPCKQIKPVLESLITKYSRQLVMYTVDIGTTDLVEHFKIRSIPGFVFFRRNKIIHTQTGADAAALTLAFELMCNAAYPDLLLL